MKQLNILLKICCGLLIPQWTSAELFTAITDLEDLLKTEVVQMDALENYINQQENKLEFLKKQLSYYATEHEKATRNPTEYLSNPINAYLLVKRLTTDWKATEGILKNDLYKEMIENLTRMQDNFKFPTDEDLSGAAIALTRLQDTYNLDTQALARGELNGVRYSSPLSIDDCFELGRQSYFKEDFYHTILWMREALRKYENSKNNANIDKWEILEYLAYSLYREGNTKAAYRMTQELLELFPNHERAAGNLAYYRHYLAAENQNTKKRGDDLEIPNKRMVLENPRFLDDDERAKYAMLCRKDIDISEEKKSQLKCRYVHKNNPFLILAPLKEEEAYLSPRILLYHEAIYPAEMETVKSIATPRLKRATVQNHKTGELETAEYRISKSAWLKDDEHPHIAAVRKRVEDITSLTVKTAEELQVVNYGIGGHYEPHFDFARKDESNAFKSLGTGNRIATVLFYMSDVEGGATVFPRLNLSLWPQKGLAAFWMNLHSSGSGDYLTRHAACPVLIGSKWVSNVWLHEKGQELLRPCDPKDESTAYS